MNEQLQEKLVQDLRTSGFYSEMMAIRACRAAAWECHGSVAYFDKDERATRECDFEAVREWRELRDDGSAVKVVARLLGQVKKSERPWIVFADREARDRFEDGSENLLHMTAAENEWKTADVLREFSPALANGWIASGVHESFKKPTDTSRWYSAFVSVCKASESASDAIAEAAPDADVQLIKPVVVLDGLLVVAEIAAEAEIVELVETDYAGFRFEYRSDQYDRPAYYLDLVTLAGLPRYLERTAQRMAAVLEALQRGGAEP